MSFTESEKNKLLSDVAMIQRTVNSLNKIIRGPEDTSTPEGLLWSTTKNSAFRRYVTKWLWALGTGLSLVYLERILTYFTNVGS
jgi:hypothetical protein